MISPIKAINAVKNANLGKITTAISNVVAPVEKVVAASADECIDTFARAQVSVSKSIKSLPKTPEEVKSMISKILEEKGMILDRHFSERVFNAGRKHPAFPGLCYSDVKGSCLRDNKGFLKRIIIKNETNNEVFMYNPNGTLCRYYTPQEMSALKEYKYSGDQFHSILRKDRFQYVPDKDKLNSYVKTLDTIFENPEKCDIAEKPMVVYRALQKAFTPQQKNALQNVGSVFTDASFVSTTRELATAQRFSALDKSPILQISLPRGTKYLEIDDIFNIGSTRWREQELLLPRNSRFLITDIDNTKGIIKAEYLL